MPIYTYQIVTSDGNGAVLEVFQPLGAAALTRHPETGAPVRKLITAPSLTLRHGDRANRSLLGDNNLAKHGFTKYVKAAPGQYAKTVGDAAAPAFIRPNP